MLDKTFSPQTFESKLYKETEKHFKADPSSLQNPFTVMMPPPNVTGSLHLGHALNCTLQDILVRFKRQTGFDALWQPGTDHAGIATQMVVERQLAEQGITRQDLGREKFLEKVWQWKEESGNTIVQQQRRLGISADWDRSRFTMDEGLSKAVIKVFVDLYNDGLIYRAKRLVNWDPKLKTAISDLEVLTQEVKGHMWHVFYPLVDNPNDGITIATTRPETMFGDTAVAVHPEDERYQHLIGKQVRLPLTDRILTIIADDYCDPTKGTGAVKITPGHDFNDFAMGVRHNLEMINILDANAHLNDFVPEPFRGLSIEKARLKTLEMLEEQGLLVKTEARMNTGQFGDRSGAVIQPWLMDQWYVDAKVLAEPAIKAVEDGKTRFIPEQWSATYFEWLRNIQPWCISRQIWWGHQIPAWYGPDNHAFVAESEAEALKQAEAHYGKATQLIRDADVLDTWFSSALWPFSTLGWPNQTPALVRYYQTDVIVTGFDIIFFWVARMMMMGLHFTGKVPFHTVYMHALVRDEKGQKMSKSKGNIIDPLHLIDKYGSDALRFTLAILAAPGRDIKLGESRVEGYRNFITKIWNAARFLEMNDCVYDPKFNPTLCKLPLNKWIISKTAKLSQTVYTSLQDYRFDYAAGALYQFLWGTYCDIYVECLKPSLSDGVSDKDKQETRDTAAWVLVEFLKLSHPFMPLITEYLWQEFYPSAPHSLVESKWPSYGKETMDPAFENKDAVQEVDWGVQIVTEARSLRGLLNVSPALKVPLYFNGDDKLWKQLQNYLPWITHLARLADVSSDPHPTGSVPFMIGENGFFLKLGDLIDMQATYKLLASKRDTLVKEIEHLQKKLQNEAYKQAKPDQWEEDNEVLAVKKQEAAKIDGFIKVLDLGTF
ncbi:MAG: valine--tRNA ligase [Alphaproteobacteria bacterium]|jgi:valyl-tRNA synthetase|nr:valine--tRNA ligase [Alphaproteobacteria bacterium]